jgi:hypothetical protein
VNALLASWLSTPQTAEAFAIITDCSSAFRVITLRKASTLFGLKEGLRQCLGGRFSCVFHGKETRNWRKLEDHVERDESGDIASRRQRGLTLTGQPGKSQGGTTITVGLPIRTPERPRAPSAPQAPLPLPPSLTALPTLDDNLDKRKRRIADKYREGREQEDVPSIGHS